MLRSTATHKQLIAHCFVVFLITIGLEACGSIKVDRHVATKASRTGQFLAGAHEVDITPPPGYPMGGFGPAGQVSVGTWMRLYAKAIYLQDADGHNIVLVSTDLWSMPGGLADRVAQRVWEMDRDAGVKESERMGRAQFLIAATHTHHSPGNFSTMLTYNLAGSSSLFFDKDLFDFLVERIAHAVIMARSRAGAATMNIGSASVKGVMRNRSMIPFKKNEERDSILKSNESIPPDPTCPLTADPLAVRAIDPTLTVLRIDNPSGIPIAVAAFIAVHPTAMGTASRLYSSDIFGVASAAVKSYLTQSRPAVEPVVAIFNGAEGDISPNWKMHGRRTTLELGHSIAASMLNARASATPIVAPTIGFRYEIVDMGNAQVGSGINDFTFAKPWIGQALYGGAEDGYTFLHELGFVEGSGEIPCPEHETFMAAHTKIPGKKLLDSLPATVKELAGGINSALGKAQTVVPISLYCIGPLALVAVPGEPTLTTGIRIRKAVLEQLKTARPVTTQAVIVGLANEYYSYFSTSEEFCHGHYEGASTMFGPNTEKFLVSRYANLASSINNPSTIPQSFSYDPGPHKTFANELITIPIPVRVLYDALSPLDPAGTIPFTNVPRFEWNARRASANYSVSAGMSAVPHVEIQFKESDGKWRPLSTKLNIGQGIAEFNVIENDYGANIATVALLHVQKASAWVTTWIPPTETTLRELNLRFHVAMQDNTHYYSIPFQLKNIDKGIEPMVLKVDISASSPQELLAE